MEHKIRAAIATRTNQDLAIIARTDSFETEGLDGAMRRADRYLKVGADGIFIPGIESVEDLARVGTEFRDTYQIVVMSEGGKTPWLPPAELYAMGCDRPSTGRAARVR
jgi:2-methylisocitrate lyase-like PEP mutase family enzyme